MLFKILKLTYQDTEPLQFKSYRIILDRKDLLIVQIVFGRICCPSFIKKHFV